MRPQQPVRCMQMSEYSQRIKDQNAHSCEIRLESTQCALSLAVIDWTCAQGRQTSTFLFSVFCSQPLVISEYASYWTLSLCYVCAEMSETSVVSVINLKGDYNLGVIYDLLSWELCDTCLLGYSSICASQWAV